ncbi:MAG: response regulator [Myxococcota bacterium]
MPPTFLLVDDDCTLLALYKDVVEGLPVRMIFTASAKAALEIMKREQPDVLICDYLMPEIDGVELVEEVRRTWPKVRCILHTALNVPPRYGLDVPVLAKPCPPEVFRELLLDLVEEGETPRR